ncbi:17-beta-hydroxysteroid dehydrogenase type 3 isoform X1 [Paramormyrops kingsleyae]|uniref:17-beta-hydroxysteroid dehydrogenase type 3 isoform X1 n=1 Tax=Paramormyrops kingsleyae TaxID=1676925 RepID=UPI003B96CC20
MEFVELLFVSVGVSVVLFYGFKLLRLVKMVFPKTWYPLPKSFFSSMGQWAVITGASDGIGKAYALELAKHGMNLVIISRTQRKLEKAAREIGARTGKQVKVITADFTKDDIYEHIEENLRGLEVGVLGMLVLDTFSHTETPPLRNKLIPECHASAVNNVGMLLCRQPRRFLDIEHLDQKIPDLINCNVKALMKMCRIILPAMVKRKKGLILNVSSGVACSPWPMYSLYTASKVFVQRFSRCLQAEYKANGIIIQAVTPFGISTSMTGYQDPNIITFTAEDFVRTSLQYVTAGDQTYGSVSHQLLGSTIQNIPKSILHSDVLLNSMVEYVNKKISIQEQRMNAPKHQNLQNET